MLRIAFTLRQRLSQQFARPSFAEGWKVALVSALSQHRVVFTIFSPAQSVSKIMTKLKDLLHFWQSSKRDEKGNYPSFPPVFSRIVNISPDQLSHFQNRKRSLSFSVDSFTDMAGQRTVIPTQCQRANSTLPLAADTLYSCVA